MKKLRIIALLLAVMLTVALMASCASEDPSDANQPATENIVVIGPSVTEIVVALGLGDSIIGTDDFSALIDGVPSDIPIFNMWGLDAEQLIALQPDILIVTEMVMNMLGNDPLRVFSDIGTELHYVASSASIEGIAEDIRFVAEVLDRESRGEELIADMMQIIDEIRAIGETITDRRTVYIEINPAPSMFSLGRGTFLNEMIEIIGAVNVFADEDGWISVSDEAIITIDPDVILSTSEDAVGAVDEIIGRPGWSHLTAVQNGDVFRIDADSASRSNHNIVIALREMAVAVYPEYFR